MSWRRRSSTTVECYSTNVSLLSIGTILTRSIFPIINSILVLRNGPEDQKALTTKGWIRDVRELWIPMAWEAVSEQALRLSASLVAV
jgi:hypothetical protein